MKLKQRALRVSLFGTFIFTALNAVSQQPQTIWRGQHHCVASGPASTRPVLYKDKPAPNEFDELGRWEQDSLGRVELRSGTRRTHAYLAPQENGALLMLDQNGKPLEGAKHLYILARLPQAALIEPHLELTGMFSYMADSGSITLCADGGRLPVAMEDDFKALQAAYRQAGAQAGQPLLVSFDGAIAERPSMEESRPPRPTVVVKRFLNVRPGETCGSPVSDEDLRDTSWQLVKFQGGDGKALMPEDKTKYTIAFGSDGRVSARIDCNRGHGTWKSAGPSQLEFGALALTRAMCPSSPLNDRLAKDWQHVHSYRLDDGHLFLSLVEGGGTYEFEPFAPEGLPSGGGAAPGKPLEDTPWNLTRLGETPLASVTGRQGPFLILDSESHRVSGSSGCNRLTGSYEVKDGHLTFGQIVGTMMACSEGMETEKTFLQALGRVSKWKITGEQLELFDDADKLLAVFEARPHEGKR